MRALYSIPPFSVLLIHRYVKRNKLHIIHTIYIIPSPSINAISYKLSTEFLTPYQVFGTIRTCSFNTNSSESIKTL